MSRSLQAGILLGSLLILALEAPFALATLKEDVRGPYHDVSERAALPLPTLQLHATLAGPLVVASSLAPWARSFGAPR